MRVRVTGTNAEGSRTVASNPTATVVGAPVVPRTPTLLAPVVTTVPLQVLACEIADTRGLDVDQPRNLAKSVTVE